MVDILGVSLFIEYNLVVVDVCFILYIFILIVVYKGVLYVSNKMDRVVFRGDELLFVC